jgi:hypothetical protein
VKPMEKAKESAAFLITSLPVLDVRTLANVGPDERFENIIIALVGFE